MVNRPRRGHGRERCQVGWGRVYKHAMFVFSVVHCFIHFINTSFSAPSLFVEICLVFTQQSVSQSDTGYYHVLQVDDKQCSTTMSSRQAFIFRNNDQQPSQWVTSQLDLGLVLDRIFAQWKTQQTVKSPSNFCDHKTIRLNVYQIEKKRKKHDQSWAISSNTLTL